MQVRLLGEVAIGTDAGWVTVAPRARRTLAALGLAAGWVPAERLAEQVWEAELPPTWRVALRGVMAELREAAGDASFVETGAAGYRLGPKVERDVEVLRRDVGTATELLEQGRDRSLLDLLRAYVGITGDRLAPGIDAAWLATGRADVDELGLRVAELVTSAASRQGRHADAVAVARQAVAARPLVERSHRALLRALAAAADRSAAVVAFDQCRTVLADELGVDPSDETVAVYLETLGVADGAATARVPVADTSFVGREPDLAEATRLVAEPGLVTLVGRSGVGKSRLAAEVATHSAGFPGGVWWVPLGTVTEDPLVAPTVALQLGLAGPGDDHAGAITAFVAPRGRALLVLDGFDAANDGVASLVTALRDGAPELSVLATGWRRLGLEGERVHRVAAFAAPADGRPETLSNSLAVRLFVDRVRERGGRLLVDEDHAAALAALCRRCAGLPLALELVAAQLTNLPPGDVLDQLDDVALAGDDELRQVAEAGCAQLADDEAAVFRRLAVLDGPASLTTIRGVVVDDLIPPLRVVRILGELADRGLVTVRRGGPRLLYTQDDDLRRVASERLVASGEAPDTYRRLAATVRALLPDDPRTAPGPFAEQVTAVLDSVRSLLAAGVDGELDVGTRPRDRLQAAPLLGHDEHQRGALLAQPAAGRRRPRSRGGARRLDGVRALRPGLPELLGGRQRRRDPRARGLAAGARRARPLLRHPRDGVPRRRTGRPRPDPGGRADGPTGPGAGGRRAGRLHHAGGVAAGRHHHQRRRVPGPAWRCGRRTARGPGHHPVRGGRTAGPAGHVPAGGGPALLGRRRRHRGSRLPRPQLGTPGRGPEDRTRRPAHCGDGRRPGGR